jgi:hypothetical protein
MDPQPRMRLAEFLARFGHGLAADPARVQALLLDACPESRREVSLLVGVAQEGIAERLTRSSQSVFGEGDVDRAVAELQAQRGLSPESARWAVGSWANALGLTAAPPNDSVAPGATAPPSGWTQGESTVPPPPGSGAPPPAPHTFPISPPVLDRRKGPSAVLIGAAVVVLLAAIGVGFVIANSKTTPSSQPSSTFVRSPSPTPSPTPTPTPTPSDSSINVRLRDQLSDPETDEDVVVTLEGQRVAELHPTPAAPVDIQVVQLTAEGNYTYRLDAEATYVDDAGATQHVSLTGQGSIAITDGSTWDVVIHADGSISLDSA